MFNRITNVKFPIHTNMVFLSGTPPCWPTQKCFAMVGVTIFKNKFQPQIHHTHHSSLIEIAWLLLLLLKDILLTCSLLVAFVQRHF